MLNVIVVGAGGFIGAVIRYLIGLIPLKQAAAFPIKTLMINIIGCFAIGLIAAYALKHSDGKETLQLFLKVGICGGFTTFSSFALETMNLMDNGNMLSALAYVTLSVVLGVAAVWIAGELI